MKDLWVLDKFGNISNEHGLTVPGDMVLDKLWATQKALVGLQTDIGDVLKTMSKRRCPECTSPHVKRVRGGKELEDAWICTSCDWAGGEGVEPVDDGGEHWWRVYAGIGMAHRDMADAVLRDNDLTDAALAGARKDKDAVKEISEAIAEVYDPVKDVDSWLRDPVPCTAAKFEHHASKHGVEHVKLDDSESFHMPETVIGCCTIYVRVGGDYYFMVARSTASHNEAVLAVMRMRSS